MLISIETRHRKKSTCRYERNRIMKINFKKMLAAVSSMWKLMQIAHGCYPLCSKERIGSLKNIFTC